MKSFKIIIATALIMTSIFVANAPAKDLVIDAEITSVSQQNDKNGSPFMRGFIKQERSLNGTKYTVQVPVVAFSNLEDFRADASDGQIRAIVKEQEYNGDTSYLYRTSIN